PWVSTTLDLFRAHGLEAGSPVPARASQGEAPAPTAATTGKLMPLGFKPAAEHSYRLLGTRVLVRFALKEQVAWVDAALGHLEVTEPGQPNMICDIPGESFSDGRRFAAVYVDGECVDRRCRLFLLGPIVKGALWTRAVNSHKFLFNFHAGVVGAETSCIL